MTTEYLTPQELLDAYSNGLPGHIEDLAGTEQFLSEAPRPLFGDFSDDIKGSGKGKLALPFKNALKFDIGFGTAERQTTGDCYQKGTIVLSEACNFIEDVNIGDKIYALDGGITTVISKKEKLSYKPFVKIKTKGSLPLTVTSEHLVLIGRKASKSRHTSLITKNLVKTWVPASEIKKGDYLVTPTRLSKPDKPANKFTENVDFMWFMGYFLGDGWCDDKTIEITYANHEVNSFNKCKSILESFGFNVQQEKYQNKNAFRLRCWCPELASWLRLICYDKNKSKIFPSWAIGNKDTINGLVDTDGFRSETKEVFDSTSKSLAYGVYYSMLEIGYNPTINLFHRSKNGSYASDKSAYRVQCIYNKKKNYSFRVNQDLWIYVSDVEITEGPHTVYDIGVSHKEHAFIANGVVAHNCVSHGTRWAVDLTRTTEIAEKHEPEGYIARGATEGIYGSRGYGGQGMSGNQAARFVSTQGGILLRRNYDGIDLSVYDSKKGTRWGTAGVPRALLEAGKLNVVETVSLIRTIEEARDALYNGYGIAVCSNYGFNSTRDKNGMARKQGSWNHCMAWIASDDTHDILNETLFLVQNSWGVWNGGPKRLGQPDGSFWIDEETAAGMLRQNGAWVFSNVKGFPPRKVTWTLDEVY